MTPDTTGYLMLGLAAIAVIVSTYAFTLVYRLRKVDQQMIKITDAK